MRRSIIVLAITSLLTTGCAAAAMSSPTGGSNPAPAPTLWQPGPGFNEPGSSTSTGQETCHSYTRHAYEACFAYVVNNTYLARLPYYKFGHSSNATIDALALHRLGSRFSGPALTGLERQTQGWPGPEQIRVYLPSITIIPPVNVAPDKSSAILHTRETWLIRTAGGRTLYSAHQKDFEVVEHRVVAIQIGSQPVLHKWVVYSIRPLTR